jgi:hypothetical protein
MYLKDKQSGDMVEVVDLGSLIDPCVDQVRGRFHAGEEMQDIQGFTKGGLTFPSGEVLPRCWVDRNYLKRLDI